jgi:septal ring factor EnvC (AmiA/AmiB activator)
MTKHKAKSNGATAHARAWIFSILGVLVTSLAFGGWKASQFIENELASKNELIVVQVQAQTALDQQMEGLIAQIDRLDRKLNKSADERDQLKYLRDQLERLRKIRSAK